MRGEIAVFAVIGVLSTVLHLGGFVVLRQVVESAPLANAIALLVAAVANTAANRRWTFGVRGRAGAARHQVQGLLVFGLTLAMTTWGLDLLQAAMPNASTSVETLVVAVTTAVATAVKFLAMKLWVFAPGSLRPPVAGRRRPHRPPVRPSRRRRSGSVRHPPSTVGRRRCRGPEPPWSTRFARRAGGRLPCATLEASPSPVYGAALLMRFGSKPIEGSNPSASAHGNPRELATGGFPARGVSE